MKPISGRNIAWAAFAYAALMGPVALVIAAIAARRHVEMSFGELTYFAAFAFVWQLQVPVALVVIWYLGASTVFLFWKWLEIVQFLTGLPVGCRIGKLLASDRFLINSSRGDPYGGGPYGWLHRKALVAYPEQTAGKANA
ncbi:MAG: hypothetical protein ABIR04_07140 [Cypionkella sp.]